MRVCFPVHYLFNCSSTGPNIAIDSYVAEEIMDWYGGWDCRDKEDNNHHCGDFVWLTKDGKYTRHYCTYDASCRLEECFSPSCKKEHAILAMKIAMEKDKRLFFSISALEDRFLVRAFGIPLLDKDSRYSESDKKRYVLEVVRADMLPLAICRVLMMWRESQRPLYKARLMFEKIKKFIFFKKINRKDL